MKPFPSTIPPHTVLDCILDENWRNTGILHVLDVIKWKGQDIADCETPFRRVSSNSVSFESFKRISQILVEGYPSIRIVQLPSPVI